MNKHEVCSLGQLSKGEAVSAFAWPGLPRVEWGMMMMRCPPYLSSLARPPGLSAPVTAATAVLPIKDQFTASMVLNFPSVMV